MQIVVDPIADITPTRITTESGRTEAFDGVIFATGFQASSFLMPMEIVERGGVELHDHWAAPPVPT